MPIYEYFCPNCNEKCELLRPLSQSGDKAECPRCHNSIERILSTFSCCTRDESGMTAPIGGSSCSSCSTGSCTTCGH